MPVRVKSKINFKAIETEYIKQIQKAFPFKGIKEDVLRRIKRGSSPVAGEGKYQKYSDSYKKQIKYIKNKNVRPVNLKVTGKMLDSFKIKKLRKGISFIFTDPKAIYHDELGAGKSKVIRRMLPRDNERWYRPIQKRIDEAIKRGIARANNILNKR